MLNQDEMKNFQIEMWAKLHVHGNKERKFRKMPIGWLIERLKDEYKELVEAWLNFLDRPTPEAREAIRRECADVANFAAFIHVNARDKNV